MYLHAFKRILSFLRCLDFIHINSSFIWKNEQKGVVDFMQFLKNFYCERYCKFSKGNWDYDTENSFINSPKQSKQDCVRPETSRNF